jgi:pimeloyl-ACP methyl ester carboxylesterase
MVRVVDSSQGDKMARLRYLTGIALLCLMLFVSKPSLATDLLPASAYLHAQQRVLVAPGRRLNLYCVGKGSPTVLFESGLGDGTLTWRKVQGEIAEITRACSYDRANYFFSDTVERQATAQASVDDMLALIDQAHLGGQVILVGHSRGGLNARLFTYEHTNRVAGLVLVDPTITERLVEATTPHYVHKYENYLSAGEQLQNCQHMAQRHELQTNGTDPTHCLDHFDSQHDPEEQALANATLLMETRPIFQGTQYSERENLYYPIDAQGYSTDGRSISEAAHSLGALPLVAIAANWFQSPSYKGGHSAEQTSFLQWRLEAIQKIADESTRGQYVEVASQHYVQKERPNVVIDAIRRVLAQARNSSK